MIFALRVLPSALYDIQQTYDWYEEQSENLGERFLEIIDEAFEDLVKVPFYQIRYDDVRCLPVRVFPFMIHFTIDENRKIISVSAILHTKKKPKF